jgi:hypothetical protein
VAGTCGHGEGLSGSINTRNFDMCVSLVEYFHQKFSLTKNSKDVTAAETVASCMQ